MIKTSNFLGSIERNTFVYTSHLDILGSDRYYRSLQQAYVSWRVSYMRKVLTTLSTKQKKQLTSLCVNLLQIYQLLCNLSSFLEFLAVFIFYNLLFTYEFENPGYFPRFSSSFSPSRLCCKWQYYVTSLKLFSFFFYYSNSSMMFKC